MVLHYNLNYNFNLEFKIWVCTFGNILDILDHVRVFSCVQVMFTVFSKTPQSLVASL